MSDRQKLGFAATAAGVASLYYGVLMYFDQGLLILGNGLFLVGLALLLGLTDLVSFLMSARIYGTALFFGGLFLIFYGFCIVGVLFEACGAFWLFGSFIPVALDYLRTVPVLGRLIPGKAAKKLQ